MPILRSASASAKILNSNISLGTRNPTDDLSDNDDTQPTLDEAGSSEEDDTKPSLNEVLKMPTFERLEFTARDGSLQRVITKEDW